MVTIAQFSSDKIPRVHERISHTHQERYHLEANSGVEVNNKMNKTKIVFRNIQQISVFILNAHCTKCVNEIL